MQSLFIFLYDMKITSKSRTIKFFLKSENTILFHFFFKCTFFFTKYRRSVLCFVVNVGFFFTFSLLIFLHDYRIFQRIFETNFNIAFFHYLLRCLSTTNWKLRKFEYEKIIRLSWLDKNDGWSIIFFFLP